MEFSYPVHDSDASAGTGRAVQQRDPALTEAETDSMQCYAGHVLEAALWSSTWELPQAARQLPALKPLPSTWEVQATEVSQRVAVQLLSWT